MIYLILKLGVISNTGVKPNFRIRFMYESDVKTFFSNNLIDGIIPFYSF